MVVVLTGSLFSEREASLATARAVSDTLDMLGIENAPLDLANKDWLHHLELLKPGVVFIAMHGTFAEDGQLQEILEHRGLFFTGSSSKVANLTFNKRITKKKVEELGILVPDEYTLEHARTQLPVIAKPNAEGSSVGVQLVKTPDVLQRLPLETLIEEHIEGREFSVAVIDQKEQPVALPVIEVSSPGDLFDYKAKYSVDGAVETCPAAISLALSTQLQELSLKIYKELAISQYARLDWIVRNEMPYFLEINTLPGMTPTSLINKELAAANIAFTTFIQDLGASTISGWTHASSRKTTSYIM